MAKRKYTLRFYAVHDHDLLSLFQYHDLDLDAAVYQAISSFVKGEYVMLDIPDVSTTPKSLNEKRRFYQKFLTLDTKKDADAIKLLESIKEGRRNNFLKSLLRLYLAFPFSVSFFETRNDFFTAKALASSIRKPNAVPVVTSKSQAKDTTPKKSSPVKQKRPEKQEPEFVQTNVQDVLDMFNGLD